MAMRKKRPVKDTGSDRKGKRVGFDLETWHELDLLAHDRMMTFQELADEAFRDVLKKHGRPYDLRDALKKSARASGPSAGAPEVKRKRARKSPNSKRPTGGVTRRARS
jgi:hypothetical protein